MDENVIPLRPGREPLSTRHFAALMEQEQALAQQWEHLFAEWDAIPVWRIFKWRRGLRAVQANLEQRRKLLFLMTER